MDFSWNLSNVLLPFLIHTSDFQILQIHALLVICFHREILQFWDRPLECWADRFYRHYMMFVHHRPSCCKSILSEFGHINAKVHSINLSRCSFKTSCCPTLIQVDQWPSLQISVIMTPAVILHLWPNGIERPIVHLSSIQTSTEKYNETKEDPCRRIRR